MKAADHALRLGPAPVRVAGSIVALLSVPSFAHASDMVLTVPIVWIPVLVATALVSPLLIFVYARGWVARWVRAVINVFLGLVAVPSLYLAVLTLPYLDGPYADVAWTYMAALLSAGVGIVFVARASIHAGRREHDASSRQGRIDSLR